MPTSRDILVKHDKFLSSVVSTFDDALAPIIEKAQKKTLRELDKKLTVDSSGAIEFTPANQQVLRSIDRIFERQMKGAGYDRVVTAFSDQFANHLPRFQDVLNQTVRASSKSAFYSDESGPVTVYKGMPVKDWRTGKEITEIRSANGPWAGFFTSDRPVAEKFVKAFGSSAEWPSHVVSAHIQMKRPFIVDAKGAPARDFQFDNITAAHRNPTLRSAIENPAYDGVIIKNTKDEGTIYVPKDPNQVFPLNVVDRSATALPEIKFTGKDLDLFASKALDAREQLLDVVSSVGSAAKRQSLFNAGGLRMSDLTQELAKQFDKTAAQAKTLADSSVSVFYRTIADRAYQQIESGLIEGAVKYSYAGPDDSLTREFCDELITRDKAYTRDEIDSMDNGQIPDVFTSCGGFNCRHQWILSLADEEAA